MLPSGVTFADRFEGISGSAIRAIFKVLGKPGMISFAGGNPSNDALPNEVCAEIARDALRADGKRIRLGGYPVPLESDAEGRTTLLFLVPYPGACIHVPPPPPNQIVLVRYPKGIALDDICEPLWVDGTLHIETVNNDLADAAYALDARSVRLVEEGDL